MCTLLKITSKTTFVITFGYPRNNFTEATYF